MINLCMYAFPHMYCKDPDTDECQQQKYTKHAPY